MRHQILSILIAVSALLPALSFAQDKVDYEADYTQRLKTLPTDNAKAALHQAKTDEERAAVKFLYAYMTLPDIADYSPEFHLRQIRTTLRAQQEMQWADKVPQREWLHFVLPVRVNNEHLDEFRTVCYEELKERVKGISMKEAILEVNHWCHEHVTYQPSDARTSPPLSSMRSAIGRCGEESTYTVAALRAVGIPARQVYTPRWAHTDDNHAWVEAWADGEWYFLGACEPEPVLNLGWFNQPASRGMLMHTKVFGKYNGPEDVMFRTPCFTEINVTRNYAKVARTTVLVTDKDGKPCPDTSIEFRIYNYGEFYTVLSTKTNRTGRASILTGLGDFVVFAYDKDKFGWGKVTAGENGEATVCMDHKLGETFSMQMNITPPAGENNLPALTDEQVQTNAKRFAYEDSIRLAYIASWPNEQKVADFCKANGADHTRLWPLVQKSRGNYENVFTLYNKYGTKALDYLEVLAVKDLRDFELGVAEDHLQHVAFNTSDSILRHYVLCARISTEHLTPWRSAMQKVFKGKKAKQFKKNPADIAVWIQSNISTEKVWNPLKLWTAPESVLDMKHTDVRSKGLLFVAIARSLEIPARINPVNGNVEYLDEKGLWTGVTLADKEDAEKAAAEINQPKGKVNLTFTPRDGMENPKYYIHFTLSQIKENGGLFLQEYPDEYNWQNNFANGADLTQGNYLMTSGTRMADGSVLANLSFFSVEPNKTATHVLDMRRDESGVQVIGNFNSENLYYDIATGKSRSILSVTGRGYFVVALVKAGHEPSNHILHDLEREAQALEAWGRSILVLFPSHADYENFKKTSNEFTALPKNIVFGIDENGACMKDLRGTELVHNEALPIVFIGDTFNRVVFRTQGYTIGIGNQLKQTIAKLK